MECIATRDHEVIHECANALQHGRIVNLKDQYGRSISGYVLTAGWRPEGHFEAHIDTNRE